MGAGILGGLLGGLAQIAPDYAGMGLNYLGTGLLTGNWGGTSKERKNVITDTRKLRKTAYQDQVYSLTEAGLNPILAVGATPGGGSAQAVQQQMMHQSGVRPGGAGTAMAANRQAGVSEKTAGSKIEQQLAEAALRRELSQNATFERAGILQKVELNNATIDQIRANTEAQRALAALHKQDAITKGASARKLDKETSLYTEYGAPWANTERMLLEMLRPDANSAAARARDGISDFLDYGRPKTEPPSGRWGDTTWKRKD